MVYGAPVDEPWNAKDRALLEAYQILEDERCSECGNPVWLCRSDDPDITFKIEKSVCFAKRSFEEATADLSGFKTAKERSEAKRKFGLIQYPVANTESGEPLPTRRAFYERKAQGGKL